MLRVTRCLARGRKASGFLLSTVALLGAPAALRAQSVNYPELQETFGEPVTTSVTGKPQRASEAAASLLIITKDDIRRSPANDLLGVLRAYAGIDVGRWTATQGDVSIRGGVQPLNPRLLVLVNGKEVYLDFYGMTNWAGIGVQLEEIQQIEVVRGPNSALFGFNAASGVINIITVNPLQTQQANITVEAGTQEYARLSATGAFKLTDTLGLRLSGGFARTAERDEIDDFFHENGADPADPQRAHGAAELYGKIGTHTDFGISATHSSTKQTDWTNVLMLLKTRAKFTSFGAQISHDIGNGLLSAQLYRNRETYHAPTGFTDSNYVIRNKVTIASVDALLRLGTANTVRAGLDFREDRMVSSPGYPGVLRSNVYSLSSMWESAVADGLTLTLAGRLDHLKLALLGDVDQPSMFTKEDFDRSLTEFSFNGALLYQLNERSTVRATIARGVQIPSLHDFGSRVVAVVPQLPVPFVYSGDPRKEPLKIWSGEVGLIHKMDAIAGQLEVSAFYNRSSDVIATPTPQSPPLATPPAYPFLLIAGKNVGWFEALGVEASLSGRLGKSLAWALNYTWTEARESIEGNSETSFSWPVYLDRSTPRHKLKGQLSYERGPWLATIAARYTSRTSQLNTIGFPANPTLARVEISDTLAVDAKVNFRIHDHVTLELAGENLTDAADVDLSPYPSQRRIRAGLRIGL